MKYTGNCNFFFWPKMGQCCVPKNLKCLGRGAKELVILCSLISFSLFFWIGCFAYMDLHTWRLKSHTYALQFPLCGSDFHGLSKCTLHVQSMHGSESLLEKLRSRTEANKRGHDYALFAIDWTVQIY